MDLLYSSTLLLSLIAGGAAILLSLVRWPRVAGFLTMIGTLSLVVSVAVHWIWGHGQSSPEPMTIGSFVANHMAFVWTGVVVLSAFLLTLRAGRLESSG